MNQKFAKLSSLKDIIGEFGPSEPFGVSVISFDERGDASLEGRHGAIDAAPDRLIGEEREEALDLVSPYELVGQVRTDAPVLPAIFGSMASCV
ncbi:hypothetical protein [Bradyrhizobium ottawaense]|uniref:hypothetical protein n=1 Tax=Bradyrhizobium ottawaense TaxID=931866 RepID=UPI003F9F0CE1